MFVSNLFARLRSRCRGFAEDRRGASAVILAICFVPLILMIGVSIDYGRALLAKSQVQQALDETALLLAKSAPVETTAQLQTQADASMAAELNGQSIAGLTTTVSYQAGGSPTVHVTASGYVPTTIGAMLGINQLNVSDSATVTMGGGPRLRVSLVLDNTGSMAQSGKITALRTAATNLLQQLQATATDPADVYVSIIPFTTDINIGSSNASANWLSGVVNASSWNGCVVDRGDSTGPDPANYDVNVAAPNVTVPGSMFPADQGLSSSYADDSSSDVCPEQVMPLGNNWSAMDSEINNMVANGYTNQAVALAHGWQSLVGGGPYPAPPPMDPTYPYEQVIIILTDGLNTKDRWYPSSRSGDVSPIDNREALACANIKASGIQVYTIQVDTDGGPQSAVLQTCASSAASYYMLTSSDQLVQVFQQIGSELSHVRLSQ
jgi:Flp pilus assembly protein TadG